MPGVAESGQLLGYGDDIHSSSATAILGPIIAGFCSGSLMVWYLSGGLWLLSFWARSMQLLAWHSFLVRDEFYGTVQHSLITDKPLHGDFEETLRCAMPPICYKSWTLYVVLFGFLGKKPQLWSLYSHVLLFFRTCFAKDPEPSESSLVR